MSKIKQTLSLVVMAMALLVLLVPVCVSAAPAAEQSVKVGDIVAMSGDVSVRTKGAWSKLTKVPYPLYSTDKIVTKKGRAEVRFVDGGSLRVNVDSNLSITQLVEMKGLFTKKPVSTRQINVLVGDAWFDVKVTKDKQVNFKTPSMTAAIRGTSGIVGADVSGGSKWGLATGSAAPEGQFTPVPNPTPMTPSDVITSNLPPSNPVVQQSPLMQAVAKAVEANSQATQAAAKSGESTEAAKAAGDQAVKSQAGDGKDGAVVKDAAVKSLESAAIKAAAAVVGVQAQISTKEEALIEAKLVGNKAAQEMVQKSLDSSKQTLEKVVQKQAEVIQIVTTAKTEANPIKAMAAAAQANTKADTAKANASSAKAESQVAIAAASRNPEAVAIAQKQVVAIQQTVALSEKQEVKAAQIVEQAQTSNVSLAVMVTASTAITQASQTISASANMQAAVAVETTSGDTTTLSTVTAVSAQTEQLATTVDTATNQVVTAVETNDLASATTASQTTSDAVTYTETTTQTYEQPVIQDVPQEPTTTTTSPSG